MMAEARAVTLIEGHEKQKAQVTRLEFDNGHVLIKRGSEVIVDVQSFEFNFQAPKTISLGERSADRVTLRALYPATASYAGGLDDLPVEIVIERIDGGFHFSAKPEWAQNTTVRLRDLDDHFFGLLEMLYPNNRPSSDLRGSTVDIDAFGNEQQYHENHTSVWSAFYMTARGYASFFDSFAKGRYSLGIKGETELYHRTGALDWYIFLGRDGDELLAGYYRVIGAPKAPPIWALGPLGGRGRSSGGAAEIQEDARRLAALKIPFTAWFVNGGYSDGANGWSKMNFNEKFAKPREWIAKLDHSFDLKLITGIAPLTFGDTEFPGTLGDERTHLDLSNSETLKEFERRLALQYVEGVRGHKNSLADERFPELSKWADGTPADERRNKYLFLYAKVTHDALVRAWGAEQFNFARSAFHRTQPYLSALWGGDARASWAGLSGNLANSLRCGFMGFPVWGTEVGVSQGGGIDEELYARWLEWSAWNGLFAVKIDGMSGANEERLPWGYSERLNVVFRRTCEQRMLILPYVFSLAQTSARTGVLMKPLAYVWPGDPATYSIADEYMFGPALLVAPITQLGGRRSVYLPAGRWHDYYEPSREYEGKKTIEVTAPFDRIPVFVRSGSIYVTGLVPQGTRKSWEPDAKPALIINAAPGEEGEPVSFELVDSFDQNRAKILTVERTGRVVRFVAPELGAGGELRVRYEPPVSVKINGRAYDAKYDPALRAIRIPFPAGTALDVIIGPSSAPGRLR